MVLGLLVLSGFGGSFIFYGLGFLGLRVSKVLRVVVFRDSRV